MALVDYIPVILFALAAIILLADLHAKMSKWAFTLFAAGVVNIAVAGALKATYKLLYAAGVCDFAALSNMFFPSQSIGFLLAGIGIILLLSDSRRKLRAVPPPAFSGTFLFVGLMVAGLGCMDAGLSVLSVKLKKPWLIALFALSFVCSLCMGYLSSKDFAEAAMNWIAEGVNVVGQGALFAGVLILHKSGLRDLELSNPGA